MNSVLESENARLAAQVRSLRRRNACLGLELAALRHAILPLYEFWEDYRNLVVNPPVISTIARTVLRTAKEDGSRTSD
jgi:hypothetical protein